MTNISHSFRNTTAAHVDHDNYEFTLSTDHAERDPGIFIQKLDELRYIIGYLVRDDDARSPLEECDGMGSIATSHRHAGPESYAMFQDAMGLDKNWQRIPDHAPKPYVVKLDCYEHGRQVWAVQGSNESNNFPDRQWDVAAGAGVWIPDSYCLEMIEARPADERSSFAITLAEQVVEEFNHWLAGDCYGCCVDSYQVNPDTMEVLRIDEESSWGIYGEDAALEILKEEMQGHQERACLPKK